MANVSFYLNYSKRDKKGFVPIYLTFTSKGKRSRHYTGEKIESPLILRDKYWDKENQRVSRKHNDSEHINDVLDDLEERYSKSFREEKVKGKIPSVKKTKAIVEASTGTHTVKNDFITIFNEYINGAEGIKASGTIKNYKNSLFYITTFSNEKRFPLEFDSLDFTFNEMFYSYLVNSGKITNNTIGRIYKNLKSFLNWATDKKYNTNLDFKKFKVLKESKEVVYLTTFELNKLLKKKIADSFLSNIRDIFCLGCYTGQRISDLKGINPDNVVNGELLLRIKKTKDILRIPLLPEASKILKKHNFELPKYNDVQINKHIKDICEDVGIDDPVMDVKYRGSERIDTKYMKYQLISTHVARKTFVTLCLEKGMPVQDVMAFTGHKDYKTMRPYIKVSESAKKNSLFNAWTKKNK